MKKITLLLKTMCLAIFAAGASANLFAVTITIVPDKTTTGSTSSSYVTTITDFTADGIGYAINAWNPTSLQTRGTSASPQFQFYNTTEIPGNITKITINTNASNTGVNGSATGGNLNSASIFLAVGAEAQSGTGTTGLATSTAGTNCVYWDVSGNYKFFRIQYASGATTGSAFISNIEIEYSTSANQVFSPTFSPVAGTYTAPQTVSIATTTAGADIYYTTDGTTPSASSTHYTAPFSVSTTTTVKAIAIKDGMDNSAVTTATYTFPAEVGTLAEMRAKGANALVKYTGTAVVTFAATPTTGNRNVKYIQDASGAMFIDDSSGMITGTYATGDQIGNFTGTLVNYNGLLQLAVSTDAVKGTSGNTVNPTIKTLENLAATDQAMLIGISNVSLDPGDGDGKFARGSDVTVSGASNIVVRPQYYDLNYIETAIPTTPVDLVGLLLVYNATLQIVPRSSADILPAGTLNTPNAKLDDGLNVYAENGVIYVKNLPEHATVDVYDLTGKLMLQTVATEIPLKANGIFVVKVNNQAFKIINK